ncbi:hypothetical protein OAW31_03150 [Candidatus Pelagibacter ubique]|jgi:hypothetical protein|nr:hypothetical protein [Candidatus Pelagibacter ubique]
MKKLLSIIVLGLLLSGNAYAYKNIKLLDKIDLTIDADIQTVLTSIKEYNSSATCEILFTKKGDYIPTSVRFSVNDNLNEVYDFFRKYNKSISITCSKFKYKFLTKNNEYSVLGTNVLLNISFCKNRVTEVNTHYSLGVPVFGDNPKVLKRLVSEFRNYSNKSPRKEPKDYGERNVWVDMIFEDAKNEVQFSIIQSVHESGFMHYQSRIIELKKYSRCFI